eukprot:Gb_07852 [translate_table: standard]
MKKMAQKINLDWSEEVNDVVHVMREEMEIRMGRMEEKMDGFMARMERLMGKRIEHLEENSTEETLEVKGVKQCFLPKVEMKNFDGRDVRTWLSQMEQYFNLHQVPTDKKIPLASLHMETEPFQWYQWMKKKWASLSYKWENFVDDIIAQYDNVWEADYLSQLTKIRQVGSVDGYISTTLSMHSQHSLTVVHTLNGCSWRSHCLDQSYPHRMHVPVRQGIRTHIGDIGTGTWDRQAVPGYRSPVPGHS